MAITVYRERGGAGGKGGTEVGAGDERAPTETGGDG
jgi:hypothetical protein